jgi:hypothetical protein
MESDVPGFQNTASYFERRASKARDPEARRSLGETAAFYRSLAAVVPGFPPAYKRPPRNGNPWTDRADECRALAECTSDPECRRQLEALADDYDRMAKQS